MATAAEQLADLLSDVQLATTVLDSVNTYIDGVPAIIQAAVDAAVANGATPEQIQPVVDAGNLLEAKANEIKAKIVANTPQSGQAPPSS